MCSSKLIFLSFLDQDRDQISLRSHFKWSHALRFWTLQRKWRKIKKSIPKCIFGYRQKIVTKNFPGLPIWSRELSNTKPKIWSLKKVISQGVYKTMNFSYEDVNWPSPIPSGRYRGIINIGGLWMLEIDTDVISDIKTSF